MKVSLLQENLNKGVGIVGRTIANRAQLPILSNILMVAEPGKLKLTSTNLETGVSVWLAAKTETKGKTTVPARVLTELVATLPQETVNLELDGDKLKLACGQFKATVNGMGADEYPDVPSLKGKTAKGEIKLKKALIKEAVEQAAVAAGVDDSRPIFTGVKVEICPTGLRLAATDGYRLSVKTVNQFKARTVKKTLVVPARALLELARSLDFDSSDELILAPTDEEKQLIFSLTNLEIVTRLLEGEYPDFDKIIPKNAGTKLEVGCDELRQAVKAAAVFARDSANIVKFKINSRGLTISANAPQVGENEVGVEAKTTGDDSEVAFNSRYLLEMLAATKAKSLSLECSGPLSPGLFKIPGDSSWLHIIMPVRVQ
ncbi:MAG: DNA polymerase III subunit beta, partial [Candidatus Beckwithbacteria bacterium]|nr:DNA polymerase III subunit beta [Candidatus Beckwithbacteria bacterium]